MRESISFLVKLFLERLGGLEDGVGVGIFRVQVSDNFGVFLFAKPGVVVDAAIAV